MGKVSLVGKTIAKEGQVYTYLGPAEECEICKLRPICQNQTVGSTYRVVKVREKEHDCPIHDQEKVLAVEIEELPLEISIPSRKALESALVTIEDEGCGYLWCVNNHLCRLRGIPKGTRVALLAVSEELVCPKGLSLKRAVVEVRN